MKYGVYASERLIKNILFRARNETCALILFFNSLRKAHCALSRKLKNNINPIGILNFINYTFQIIIASHNFILYVINMQKFNGRIDLRMTPRSSMFTNAKSEALIGNVPRRMLPYCFGGRFSERAKFTSHGS